MNSLDRAINLYTRFHWGKQPRRLSKVKIYIPDHFVKLGKLLGVIYLADKGDGHKPYIHFFGKNEPLELVAENGEIYIAKKRDFKLSEFPDLLTDDRGKHLYIVNFKGRVKDEGIIG